MAIELANAISAYNAAAKRVGEGAPDATSAAPAEGGGDFASMLRGFAHDAIATGHNSEKMSVAAAAGQADINDVVVAVAEAELALNTVTSIRDKVISAYQQIIRMPI